MLEQAFFSVFGAASAKHPSVQMSNSSQSAKRIRTHFLSAQLNGRRLKRTLQSRARAILLRASDQRTRKSIFLKM